ncbi:MAG: MFS transporter [Streptosporangiales bacterium]|nr:MFS transporter [Streptosporangiales bacterium]
MRNRLLKTSEAAAGVRSDGRPRLRRALVALCVTEITSWGVLYYAFPVMLSSVTRDTGWSTATAMGAFSTGALTSAVAGVGVGRLLDARGPRLVMTSGSVLGVAAVIAIAGAPNLGSFFAAWVLAGLAQSALLYPPAFVALTRWYGPDRVRALTTLTLVAGFASTVFAPLTAALLDHLHWRAVYLVLAAVLGAVTIPLHALCLTAPWPGAHHTGHAREGSTPHARRVLRSRSFGILAAAMATAAFGMFAATINLVPLFTARGMSNHLGALALGLCGAGQVLGRLGYAPLARRTTPRARTVGVLAAGAVTVLALGLLQGPAAALIIVAVLAGLVRGIHTLLSATAVADRWGTEAFGRINGVFVAPITAVVALAPGGGSFLAELTGSYPTAYSLLALLTLVAAAAAFATNPDGPRRRGGPRTG